MNPYDREHIKKILVWLPGPLGDAVMCTPALRAIRNSCTNAEIHFLASNVVKDALSPTSFCDGWIAPLKSPIKQASALKKENFDCVVLFKNSFSCALTVFLAKIPVRIGYARDKRSWLLTNKIVPRRKTDGKYQPYPMMNYYLELLTCLGIDETNTQMELSVSDDASESLKSKLPELFKESSKYIIFVPGGAFGPSKCWPTENFAKLAGKLKSKYDCQIVVSIAPNEMEIKLANEICEKAQTSLINLADSPLSLGELKALFANAWVVVTNDTGPRHFAVALKKNVVTMFGPNDPIWTDSKAPSEIQIAADVECAPCLKPVCKKEKHYCMESITVEMIENAIDELLAREQA